MNFRTTAVGDGTKKYYADRSSYVTVTTRDWRGAMVIGPEVEQFFCEMVPLQLTGPKSGAALQVLKYSTTISSYLGKSSYQACFICHLEHFDDTRTKINELEVLRTICFA